jgi:CheY-like chemotaxis protein
MSNSQNSSHDTILIADDYKDNRELLRFLLTDANYRVLEAKNGEDCIAIAKSEQPNLILVDLSMPGLDGWGVFEELRCDARTAAIPCIAVTAHELERTRAIEMGFADYVPKPFRTNELLTLVGSILSKQRTTSEAT